MRQELYWPPLSNPIKKYLSLFMWWMGVLYCWTLFLLPLWFIGRRDYKKEKRFEQEARQYRRRSQEATNSVLMARVRYVGGHPVLPHSEAVVIGLSQDGLAIYTYKEAYPSIGFFPPTPFPFERYVIERRAVVSFSNLIQVGTGRPKTARQIYDEDQGYTIDVTEHSPFLTITFELEGDTYQASFQGFESPHTPQKWYNQMAALRYQLRQTSTGNNS